MSDGAEGSGRPAPGAGRRGARAGRNPDVLPRRFQSASAGASKEEMTLSVTHPGGTSAAGERSVDVDTLRERQAALHRQGALHWWHWVIVGLSVVITFFAWNTSRSALEERAQRRFAGESERVIELMRERLRHYEDALLSAAAAMQIEDGVMTRERWRRYAEYLDLTRRYPGVNGIGVIHYVEEDELDAYVERLRGERPESGYDIRPEHGFGVHLPIAYLEPEESNIEAIGLDVAFESNRRTAALRARRLGSSQISGPIVLVQDAGRTPGLLFYVPFYDRASIDSFTAIAMRERAFEGLVYVPLVVRSLVAGVLGRENRQVALSIRDGSEVLYSEGLPDGTFASTPTFSRERTVFLYGRTWTFSVWSTPAFDAAFGTNQPAFVLAFGLTIDAMLLILFALMSRSNRRTLSLANDLTNDLSAQAAELTENNRDLERFARVVSHDLKTPIRGIQDLTDFLEEDLGDYLGSAAADPSIGRNLERLREQARKGNALITGILHYSVVGLENESLTRVDCRRMIEGIGESLGLTPEQLVIDGDPPVFDTYEVSLGQVLSNLIGNASKYNPDPKRAVVRVSVERCESGFRFAVADNGPGIEPRFHERVFEAFTTLERRPDADSSGIGLSIVKKAVERLGGTVELESEPGQGSTFRFTWPVADADPVSRRAA